MACFGVRGNRTGGRQKIIPKIGAGKGLVVAYILFPVVFISVGM